MSPELIQAQLTLGFALFLMLPLSRLTMPHRMLAFALTLTLGSVPWDGLPVAAYLRGIIDDLAITTLAWMGWVCFARIRCEQQSMLPAHHWHLVILFALLALIIYPASLGLTYLDPYRLGYSARPLLGAMFVVAVCLWYLRNRTGSFILMLATLAYALNIKNSTNFWDYLVDPVLGIYCLGALLARLPALIRRKSTSIATKRNVTIEADPA